MEEPKREKPLKGSDSQREKIINYFHYLTQNDIKVPLIFYKKIDEFCTGKKEEENDQSSFFKTKKKISQDFYFFCDEKYKDTEKYVII